MHVDEDVGKAGWEIGCIGSWLHLLLVLVLLQLLAGVVAASADEGRCTA